MEWYWYIVALPFFLWGLFSIVIPSFLMGAVFMAELFKAVWDKESVLTWKDGAKIYGIVLAIYCVITLVLIFIAHASKSTVSSVTGTMQFVMIAIFLTAIIRAKFKFALSLAATGFVVSVFLAGLGTLF